MKNKNNIIGKNIAFIHIPRTAGTYFTSYITNFLRKNEYKIDTGGVLLFCVIVSYQTQKIILHKTFESYFPLIKRHRISLAYSL